MRRAVGSLLPTSVKQQNPKARRRPTRRHGTPGAQRKVYGKGESLLRDMELGEGVGIPTGSIATIATSDVVPLFETVSAPLLFTFINALRDRYAFNNTDVAELAKATGVMAPALLQICPWFDMSARPTSSTTPNHLETNSTTKGVDSSPALDSTNAVVAGGTVSSIPTTEEAVVDNHLEQHERRCRRRDAITGDHQASLVELQVQNPSQWLRDVEYGIVPESVQEWEDVLFTLTNHPSFHNGAAFLSGHTSLLSVLAAYAASAVVVATRDVVSLTHRNGTQSTRQQQGWGTSNIRPTPYTVTDWQPVDGRGNPIPAPASSKRGGSASSNGSIKRVLQTPFGPRLMRKLRQKYIAMMRIKEFSELFRGVVGCEQAIITSLGMGGGDRAEERLLVPSVGCDKEHLVFFAAIHGRRECTDPKIRRWEDTLANVRTAVPLTLLLPPSNVKNHSASAQGVDTAIANLAKVSSNVCMFLANDNAEEHRAVSLIRAVCDVTEHASSGSVPLAVLTAFVEALYTAAIDKLRVTKGASLASTLCVISFTQTCRHILRLTPNGVSLTKRDVDLLRADFTASLTQGDEIISNPTSPSTTGSSGNTSSSSAQTPEGNDRMLKLDMLERSGLGLLAPIRRQYKAHIEMVASALRDVLSRLSEVAVGRGRRGHVATIGQCEQVLEWLDAQVKLCTPIPVWTDAQELRTVINSSARASSASSGYGRQGGYNNDGSGDGMTFRDAMMTALQTAGHTMFARDRSFVWTCGCGSANPIENISCWSCAADEAEKGRIGANVSKCVGCMTTIDGAEATSCLKCHTSHPRDSALKGAGLWFCEGCTSVTSTSVAKCESCGDADPTRIPHTCPGCSTVTIGKKPLLCTTCGWADPAKNVRLWVCSGCQRMNPVAGDTAPRATTSLSTAAGKDIDGTPAVVPPPTAQCTFCHADGGKVVEYNATKHQSFNAFQWVCGCGVRNSPTSLKCRGCAGTNATSSAITHTCPSCEQLVGVTAKHKVEALAGMCFCSGCRTELHPRDATMVARRLTVCPACHGITPTASESCQHCKATVPESLTRFLPTFADLPWSCHSCGGINCLHMQDGESGLVCGHCEVDRISPLLFSECEPWDCNACGFKSTYGFACARCRTLHSSVPAAEVPLWTCGDCRRQNFSWKQSCVSTSCTSPRPTSQAKLLRYQPWECVQCSFKNGPQMVRGCGKCKAARPVADVCDLCGDRHLSYMCSGTEEAGKERLERLKAVLLTAAVGGDNGADDSDPDGQLFAEEFGRNPPAFEFDETPVVELPMMWM